MCNCERKPCWILRIIGSIPMQTLIKKILIKELFPISIILSISQFFFLASGFNFSVQLPIFQPQTVNVSDELSMKISPRKGSYLSIDFDYLDKSYFSLCHSDFYQVCKNKIRANNKTIQQMIFIHPYKNSKKVIITKAIFSFDDEKYDFSINSKELENIIKNEQNKLKIGICFLLLCLAYNMIFIIYNNTLRN